MSATDAPVHELEAAKAESGEPNVESDLLEATSEARSAELGTRSEKAEAANEPIPAVEVSPSEKSGEGEKRVKSAELIAAAALPPVLRERLAQLMESGGDQLIDGPPRLPLEACLRAIEESLPEFLRPDRASASAAAHPSGEVFFHGQANELSDSEAEEMARRQLARSGLLRGQRARVAD